MGRFRDELTALGGHVDVVDHIGQTEYALQRVMTETEPQIVVTWHRDAFHEWAVVVRGM